MKLNLKKAAATSVVAGALLLAAPVAAQAATQAPTYPPSNPSTVVIEITESGPVPVPGFAANVDATAQLSGRGIGPGSLATANLPVTSTSITKKTDANGAVTFNVTLPDNPSGPYTLAVTGARADGSVGTDTTVVGSGSGSGSSGSTNASGSNSLPATGMDANSLLGFWVGGGALVLAGATVAVATTVRRNRQGTKA
ncbi:LPXTG cell wall anchor domain-containing protein [Microbacterium sp. PRF11]|uniref:LPXTG cell wall anchor domain-containing protein n=1 Tax=Microbacterium sp. PRF11 TaxID=2962593 RepID=UPI002880E7B0|nr:LPXTG cell wall anchor domain-containing protein [Microbacterium sp. PRF11]MDT0117725.1 LPXTG cell wall anchor domain-containing protein [Microbacterium sp. PRF11]